MASKTRWKVKTKKQALLQRIQDRVMANDRQSVKQRMMRDEFRFYTLAAYLRDKYPPPEQRKVSTKWIIEDFSKIDWPGLFPHIDRDVLLKEIQRQEEAINMNIHNINRMAETKPDRYCHPHAQQKTKMRAMEMIKEKNNISSGKNMQGYTFELLLSDTTNTERGHQREMKETIKKQYVEQSFPFINTNGNKRQHQFRPHTKKDECSSHVSRVREVEKELFLNRPADLESQEKLRPVKPFTAKHNLLSKTAPWQEQLKEFNEAVQINNPTTGDTYHSQLSTEATPTLIYRENASLKMEQLKSQQGADEKLRPFIRQLKRQPINTVIQGYFMQKGILCYLQKDDRAPGGKTPLLVIPETAARHLIFQIHNNDYTAHPGQRKLESMIRRKYKILGLSRIVKETVADCHICPLLKPSVLGARPTLATRLPKDLSSVLYCDILTIDDASGCKVILWVHATSQLTFGLMLDPSKDTSEQILEHFFRNIFPLTGPICVVSDNESVIAAGAAPFRYRALNCPKTATPPHMPCSNIAERLNRSLLSFMRSSIATRMLENPDVEMIFNLWIYCHNYGVSSVDNLSPIEKFTIRRHKTLDFAGLSNYDFFQNHLDSSAAKLLQHQQAMLQYLHDLNKQRRQKGYEKFQNSKYDNINPFKIGQLVVLKDGKSKKQFNKLEESYRGPFCIIAQDGLSNVLAAYKRQDLLSELNKTTYRAGNNLPLFKTVKVTADQLALCPRSMLRKADCSNMKAYPPFLFFNDETPSKLVRRNLNGFIKSRIIDKRAKNLEQHGQILHEEGTVVIEDHTPETEFLQEEQEGILAEEDCEPYDMVSLKGHARDPISMRMAELPAENAVSYTHLTLPTKA